MHQRYPLSFQRAFGILWILFFTKKKTTLWILRRSSAASLLWSSPAGFIASLFACESTEMSALLPTGRRLFFHRLPTQKITQLSKPSTFECILGNGNPYLKDVWWRGQKTVNSSSLWMERHRRKIIITSKILSVDGNMMRNVRNVTRE